MNTVIALALFLILTILLQWYFYHRLWENGSTG
jgi:hypothetical protein